MLNKLIIKRIFILFILLALPLTDNISHAADKDDKAIEKELGQLKTEISKLQNQLEAKRKLQSEAVQSLRKTEKRIATASKILKATNRQLKQKNNQLAQLKKQKTQLDKNREQQKDAIAAQIKSAYVSGKQEYLKMLLNQEDPAKLGRMLIYYDYMNKARRDKILQLQNTLKELSLVNQKIEREISDLNILKQSREAEAKRLQALKSERQKLVASLAKDIDEKTEKLTELEINASELQELIDSVQQTINKIDFSQPLDGLKNLKGKLNWPVKGKKLQSYGSRLAEGLKSNGVIISASEGQSINAIHHGRVVYADWLRGFGLLVILDHGDGYMSLYGYNQALYKQVGDFVNRGETIASAGQSGGQQKPGLYFELRHQGKPFNPSSWIN
ncbi:MAG: peptidoglycan DD-metalloendopeptidase family protein [Gammaproteobacteria bacterium]|nr:peptidoglycan DD-metalloendopeptidase family protein [Gammaproteobacteria bacterium]